MHIFVTDDFESDYEALLNKSNKGTIAVGRLRSIEVLSKLNNLNSRYLHNMFIKNIDTGRNKNGLQIPTMDTLKFGNEKVNILGPQISKCLPKPFLKIRLDVSTSAKFAAI